MDKIQANKQGGLGSKSDTTEQKVNVKEKSKQKFLGFCGEYLRSSELLQATDIEINISISNKRQGSESMIKTNQKLNQCKTLKVKLTT